MRLKTWISWYKNGTLCYMWKTSQPFQAFHCSALCVHMFAQVQVMLTFLFLVFSLSCLEGKPGQLNASLNWYGTSKFIWVCAPSNTEVTEARLHFSMSHSERTAIQWFELGAARSWTRYRNTISKSRTWRLDDVCLMKQYEKNCVLGSICPFPPPNPCSSYLFVKQ